MYPLRVTQKQPASWDRKPLHECFSLIPCIGQQGEMQAKAGDVVVKMGRGALTAYLADTDEQVKPGNGGLLRSKGLLRPEILVMLLSEPSVLRDLQRVADDSGSVMSMMRLSSLKNVVIGVPDPQTQHMIIDANHKSVLWLEDYASNLHRQSEIMNEIGGAIRREILEGRADPVEALGWIQRAVPSSMLKIEDAPDYIDRKGVDMAEEDALYVSKAQHTEIVGRLQARIRALEEAAPKLPYSPSRGPRQ